MPGRDLWAEWRRGGRAFYEIEAAKSRKDYERFYERPKWPAEIDVKNPRPEDESGPGASTADLKVRSET